MYKVGRVVSAVGLRLGNERDIITIRGILYIILYVRKTEKNPNEIGGETRVMYEKGARNLWCETATTLRRYLLNVYNNDIYRYILISLFYLCIPINV